MSVGSYRKCWAPLCLRLDVALVQLIAVVRLSVRPDLISPSLWSLSVEAANITLWASSGPMGHMSSNARPNVPKIFKKMYIVWRSRLGGRVNLDGWLIYRPQGRLIGNFRAGAFSPAVSLGRALWGSARQFSCRCFPAQCPGGARGDFREGAFLGHAPRRSAGQFSGRCLG